MPFEGMTWNDHFCCLRYLRYLSVSTFRWSWRPRTCGNSLTHKGPPANMYMIDMIEGDLSSEVLEICWWLYTIFVWHMPKQCRRYSISQKSRGFPAVFIEFSPNFGRDALMILQIGWVTVSERIRTPKYNGGIMGEPLSYCISTYCLIPWTPPVLIQLGLFEQRGPLDLLRPSSLSLLKLLRFGIYRYTDS